MKVFEKYNKACPVNVPMKYVSDAQFIAYIEEQREKFWRIALNWVSSDCECTGDDGHSCIDWYTVREELNESNNTDN